jgi:hypothetical protein
MLCCQSRLREAESAGREMKEDFQQLNAFYNAEKAKQLEMQQALTRSEQQITALAMVAVTFAVSTPSPYDLT